MENQLIPTSEAGYFKDPASSAIINTNEKEYRSVLERREKAKQLNQLQSEVNDIKTDIKDIKDLLLKALSGR